MDDQRLNNPTWLHTVHRVAYLTAAEIARALQVDSTQVEEAIAELGDRPPRRPPQLDDTAFLVQALVTDGHTIEGLARLLGCSATAVRNAAKREPHTAALTEASWDPDANAALTRLGRPRINPGPDHQTLLRLTDLRGEITIPWLVAHFDLDDTQERRAGTDLRALVAAGELTATAGKPVVYRRTLTHAP